MNSVLENFCIDDCYEILKRKCDILIDCTVESYKFYPLNEKMGFLGDHCFLKITYTDGNQRKTLKVFTKAMCSTESQKTFAIETGAFYKECGMFQKLIPKFLENDVRLIQDCVPSCYLVSDMNYLIFEDLGLKGYKTVSQRECMSLDCVKSSLKALAKFHASAIIFEEKMMEKYGEPYVLSEKFPKLFKETFYTAVQCSVNMLEATKKGAYLQIDLFEDPSCLNTELFKQLVCKTFDQFKDIVKPSTLFRNTICHGDLWAFNIMFKFEDDKPIRARLIDFQSYRYSPPAQDFLSFMYFSTDRKFRQQHIKEMINLYYNNLEEVLGQYDVCIKKVLPYHEFIDSCDYYKIFCIAQTINHFQLVMVSVDAAKDLFAVPDALQKVIFEDKSPIVQELCEKDGKYRQIMKESIHELRDVYIEKDLLQLYI